LGEGAVGSVGVVVVDVVGDEALLDSPVGHKRQYTSSRRFARMLGVGGTAGVVRRGAARPARRLGCEGASVGSPGEGE
jgi:hypothetical protein